MRTLRTALSVMAIVAVLGTSANTAGAQTARDGQAGRSTYLDSGAPVDNRVSDLLGRMTLLEKAGQMDQILVANLRGDCHGTNGDLVPDCENDVFVRYATGSILAGGTDNPLTNTAEQWAKDYNAIQHYAIEHSRLHIPVLFGVDAVHGFGHPVAAPLFPQEIGLGATWDPAMAEAAGAATGRVLGATGWVWDFAPVQDLARDVRWGRYYETWSEAPVLAGTLGASFIKGLQNPTEPVNALKTTATVKHFAGYSQSITGHDRVEAQLPIRYLQDTILPSYGAGIDAGTMTVMVNSGSVNGVPATASHYLLTNVLRRDMGFRGLVISDYGDVRALQTAYHLAPDYPSAIALAVNAGVDMAMEPSDPKAFTSGLIDAVQSGKIATRRIDEAVGRILRVKFQLGLFDHPYVDPGQADPALESGRPAALRATRESITLLRNENKVLPLSTGVGHVVVTGPNADSVPAQLGGWSVSWQGVFGGGQVCCAGGANEIPPTVTILEGIETAIGASKVIHATGQAAAVLAAASADAVVVVVGEGPYAEGLGDKPDPILPVDQQALIAALRATGKPVIVVVVAGRPLGLGTGYGADAILMAYQGSTEAGTAVADVLFGAVNPSGRLPVSWPSASTTWQSGFNPGGPSTPGDQPKTYDQLPGTNSGQGSGYNPTFPIGFGLSYTTFTTTGLAVGAPDRRGQVAVSFSVANKGDRDGTELVPVWVEQPPFGAISVPPRQLAGFARVDVPAGSSTSVNVSISTDWLRITKGDVDGRGPRVLASGTYTVVVAEERGTFQVR
jgi:beta-glucosidase